MEEVWIGAKRKGKGRLMEREGCPGGKGRKQSTQCDPKAGVSCSMAGISTHTKDGTTKNVF